MPNDEIEKFAMLLIEHVRDRAVDSTANVFSPSARSKMAVRWKAALQEPELII
jgi:hypothetical protein